MKSIMNWTVAVVVAAGLSISAVGCKSAGGGGEMAGKAYPLSTCLVADEALDANAIKVVHNGQEVKFCCKDCVAEFQSNPDKYLSKLAAK